MKHKTPIFDDNTQFAFVQTNYIAKELWHIRCKIIGGKERGGKNS